MTEATIHFNAKTLGEIGSNEKPVKTYPKNRKCSGCGMKLSMYNPEPKCQNCLPSVGMR